MVEHHPHSHKKASAGLQVLAIIGAWISVIIFGAIYLVFTLFIASALIGVSETDNDFTRLAVLTSLFGALVLAVIILALWRVKKYTFVLHFIIGLFIGFGFYVVMLIVSMVALYSINLNNSGSNQTVGCTTARDQLLRNQAAVVPILTDVGSGTGFAIDAKGTVLTAQHVIEGASTISANYASGEIPMTLLGASEEYDVAVLRLAEATPNYYRLSAEYIETDEVYAIGYPGNALEAGPPSISKGIVSRILTNEDLLMNDSSTPEGLEIIQTDAAINPGNSGGPLVGRCGVIGIVNSLSDTSQLSDYIGVVSEQGIGYAISARSAAEKFNLPLSNSF